MNVLVTGCAGYIGSVCTEALLQQGHQVVVLDNLVTGHRAAVPAGADFVKGDISDTRLVQDIVDRYQTEAVLHFAAYSLVGESMQQSVRYFENNTLGSFRLLKALKTAGVRKFVLSSTAALFGTPETVPIAEDAPVQPASVYGETKYLIERMLHWFQQTEGLGYTTLRYFNAAGASKLLGEDHNPETHLIPLVLQAAAGEREAIRVYGSDYDTPDGTCIRDYIDVRDLAQAHLLALHALQPGEAHAYNLGSGSGFSVQEVIDVCRQVTGRPIRTEQGERRAGDPAVLIADSSLIQTELGWQRQHTDLADTISAAWEWKQAHPGGYDAD
jgi:UDP-glucose 4-epimerase